MRLRLLILAPLLAVGCAASGDEPASSDSNFSSTPAPSPDVPRYTIADTGWWTKVQTSVDGAAFVEEEHLSAVALPDFAGPNAWQFMTSPDLFVRFGVAGARKLEVGTYSCADGDASIFSSRSIPDGGWGPLLRPATCTVVIDEIQPHPSRGLPGVVVTGRFEATRAAGGLPFDVKGAFVGYFAIRPAPPPTQ